MICYSQVGNTKKQLKLKGMYMKFIGNILKRSLIFSGLIIILSCYMCCELYAFGTYFNQRQLSEADKERKLGYIKISHISFSEIDGGTIESFDISQDDTIMAVGYSDNKIGVYNTDGEWLWGVMAEGTTGPIDCEIDDIDNSLLVIYTRGNAMYKLDKEMKDIDVVSIDLKANGDVYPWLELSRPKIRGDKTYKMSSSRIWVEMNGEKIYIIDHSKEVRTQFIVYAVIALVIIGIGILMLKEELDSRNKECM